MTAVQIHKVIVKSTYIGSGLTSPQKKLIPAPSPSRIIISARSISEVFSRRRWHGAGRCLAVCGNVLIAARGRMVGLTVPFLPLRRVKRVLPDWRFG